MGENRARTLAVENLRKLDENHRKLQEITIGEAFAAILAGKLEKIESALESATEAGASQTELTVLKGLDALNRGRYAEGVDYAEKALDTVQQHKDPRRIAPLALLGAAAGWGGYPEQWEVAVAELRSLTPQTDADHLLKAYALALPYPDEALAILKAFPEINHSTVGLSIRAQARLALGIDGNNAQLLDKAIVDLEYVEHLFGDNPAVIGWRAYAATAAIELARYEQRDDDEIRYTQLAQEIVSETADFIAIPSLILTSTSCTGHLENGISVRSGRAQCCISWLLWHGCHSEYAPARSAHRGGGI